MFPPTSYNVPKKEEPNLGESEDPYGESEVELDDSGTSTIMPIKTDTKYPTKLITKGQISEGGYTYDYMPDEDYFIVRSGPNSIGAKLMPGTEAYNKLKPLLGGGTRSGDTVTKPDEGRGEVKKLGPAALKYSQALEAMNAGDFELARTLFKESFGIHPHPETLYNLGRLTSLKLNNDQAAITYFKTIKSDFPAYDIVSKLKNEKWPAEIISAVEADDQSATNADENPLTNKEEPQVDIQSEVRQAIELMINKGSPVIKIKGTPFTPEKTQVRHWVKKYFDSTGEAATAIINSMNDQALWIELIEKDKAEQAKGPDPKTGRIPRSGEFFGTIYNTMRRLKPSLKDQRKEERRTERQERRAEAKTDARRILVESLHKIARSK